VLRHLGIPFKIHPSDGVLLVAKEAATAVLGGMAAPEVVPQFEVNVRAGVSPDSAKPDYIILVYPISDPLARRAYAEKVGNNAPVKSTFPVTLYKEQWLKLLAMSDDIRAFIVANEGRLKTKE